MHSKILSMLVAVALTPTTTLWGYSSHLVQLNMGITFPSSFGGEPPNPNNLNFEEVTNLPNGSYGFSHQVLWGGRRSLGLQLSTFNRGLFLEEEDTNAETVSNATTTNSETVLRHSTEKKYTLWGLLGNLYANPFEDTGALSYGLSSGLCVVELFRKKSYTTGDSVSLEGEREHQYKFYWSPQISYSIRLNNRASLQASLKQLFYAFPFETHSALALGLVYEIRYKDDEKDKEDNNEVEDDENDDEAEPDEPDE